MSSKKKFSLFSLSFLIPLFFLTLNAKERTQLGTFLYESTYTKRGDYGILNIKFKDGIDVHVPSFVKNYLWHKSFLAEACRVDYGARALQGECEINITYTDGQQVKYYGIPAHQNIFLYKLEGDDNRDFVRSLPETLYQLQNLKQFDMETLSLSSARSYLPELEQMLFWFPKEYAELCPQTINKIGAITGKVNEVTTENFQSSVTDNFSFSYPIEYRFLKYAKAAMEKYVGFAVINAHSNAVLSKNMKSFITRYGCQSKEVQNTREALYLFATNYEKISNALTDLFLLGSDLSLVDLTVYIQTKPKSCGVFINEKKPNDMLSACERYRTSGCPGSDLIKSCQCFEDISNRDGIDEEERQILLDHINKQDKFGLYSHALFEQQYSQTGRPPNFACINTKATSYDISKATAWINLVSHELDFSKSVFDPIENERYCYLFTENEFKSYKATTNSIRRWGMTWSDSDKLLYRNLCITNIIDDVIIDDKPITYPEKLKVEDFTRDRTY